GDVMRRAYSHACRRPRRRRAGDRPLVIERLEGRILLATFTVINTADSGPGSLRQAILDANADATPDAIAFDIPAAGVHTISPTSPLPAITAPVVIDGTTQPGWSPNTNGPGLADNAVLLIELDGSTAHGNGLTLSHDSTVQGLVINRFGAGIMMSGSSRNLIQGNFIGTNAAGTAAP